jgi:spore maturation protein CgeB
MFRGRFNGILEADRHYFALDSDFANLNDVLSRFIDERERATVADAAHAHILASHTYEHRMLQLEGLLRGSRAH